MPQKLIFEKPALSIPEQLDLLASRQLNIEPDSNAAHYLATIGYYRLMAYFKPFMCLPSDSNQGFKPGTTFTHILNLYIFDRELRLLVTDALERIEVTLRAAISNTMSIKYGPHWYLQADLFVNQERYQGFLKELNHHLARSNEEYIRDYYSTYHEPEHPPSWMVIECLSFGTVSKIYENLKDRAIRKMIGDILGQFSETIKSWMKSLTYTRNLCAHHARLWNRFFINKPHHVAITSISKANASPFSLQAYIIVKLLNHIAPHHHWKNKLYRLFEKNASLHFTDMGFRQDWRSDSFWTL